MEPAEFPSSYELAEFWSTEVARASTTPVPRDRARELRIQRVVGSFLNQAIQEGPGRKGPDGLAEAGRAALLFAARTTELHAQL